MNPDLRELIASGKCLCEETASWGTSRLQITYYLGTRQSPLEYVSSVRAIVFRGNSVLVITDAKGERYIIPGGRRENGETPEETLRREVREESGWSLVSFSQLGFMHLHHLTPRPTNYHYPYPDFVWPVYLAEAGEFTPGVTVPEQYAIEAHFLLVTDVLNLPLNAGQRALLDAALQVSR